MDLLKTAVVDITTLVATCQAVMSTSVEGDLALPRELRNRIRREIKRATVAYIDTLARTKSGEVDRARLAACRVAAEQLMMLSIQHQGLLSRIMASQPGSLDGLAAARQDLWRIANMAIYLRSGVATLRRSDALVEGKSAAALAGSLRRRIRKALIAYARATLRAKVPEERLILTARDAAMTEFGKRAAADAERLSAVEADVEPHSTLIRLGVTKPLSDLALDWQHRNCDQQLMASKARWSAGAVCRAGELLDSGGTEPWRAQGVKAPADRPW